MVDSRVGQWILVLAHQTCITVYSSKAARWSVWLLRKDAPFLLFRIDVFCFFLWQTQNTFIFPGVAVEGGSKEKLQHNGLWFLSRTVRPCHIRQHEISLETHAVCCVMESEKYVVNLFLYLVSGSGKSISKFLVVFVPLLSWGYITSTCVWS